jgi:type II secretory pathway component PulJ
VTKSSSSSSSSRRRRRKRRIVEKIRIRTNEETIERRKEGRKERRKRRATGCSGDGRVSERGLIYERIMFLLTTSTG